VVTTEQRIAFAKTLTDLMALTSAAPETPAPPH
jgi:hypothetical protein